MITLLLFSIYSNAQRVVDLKSGLTASYPFNGNAKDESGNNNDGNIQGASLTADRFGKPNSAYFFDGSSKITLPITQPLGKSDFSVSIWFNIDPKADTSNCLPISKGSFGDHNYFMMYRDAVGLDENDNVYDGIKFKDKPVAGKWYNCVVTRKNDTTSIFLNNIRLGTLNKPINITNTYNWVIGSQNNAQKVHFFRGKIDDVQIYNYALSPEEVAASYTPAKDSTIVLRHDTISFKDQTINFGKTFILPILTTKLNGLNPVISSQFDFNYDASSIHYLGYALDSTVFAKATSAVNSTQEGKLSIALAQKDSVFGAGAIINLKFQALKTGTTTPFVTNFLYNTDSIKNIHNGNVSITAKYGDVDGNTSVQAYDAALVLKHSVGIDTIPNTKITIWDKSLISVADVDGKNGATAYDASLILQKVAGLISSFPIESQLKGLNSPIATISAKIVNGYLQFSCVGELYGLNIEISKNTDQLGTAILSKSEVLAAINSSTGSYKVGVASVTPISNTDPFLMIPLKSALKADLTVDMIVNSDAKKINIGSGNWNR